MRAKIIQFFIEHPIQLFTTNQISEYLELDRKQVYLFLCNLIQDGTLERIGTFHVRLKNMQLALDYVTSIYEKEMEK